MQPTRLDPPRPRDMTMLVVASAGTALLAGLLSFPIVMSGPVMAGEAAEPVPVRLPLPREVQPDDEDTSDRVCVCELALTLAD